MSLILEDKTQILRRCFFDVQNCVGIGREEEDYHQAMKYWLHENGVPTVSKYPHRLTMYGEVAHSLFPDLVAWDCIVIEVKAIPRNPGPREYVQLFDYLKCRNNPLGLLVNMGLDRVTVERIVYQVKPTEIKEDWSYWTGEIDGPARDIGARVCQALRDVYHQHTTGYGDEVIRKLILFALTHYGLEVIEAPIAKACYGDVVLRESALDCLLVENSIVLTYSALFKDNDFNLNRGRSYLKALDLNWGIAANFGKSVAQVTGMRRTKS